MNKLPLLIWYSSKIDNIIECLSTLRRKYDKICLIVNAEISREQILLLNDFSKIFIAGQQCFYNELLYILNNYKEEGKQGNVSSDIIPILLEQIQINKNNSKEFQFSNRELQIIKCAQRGLNIYETAELLNLRPSTINAYRHRLYKKSGTNSINQLLAKYYKKDPIKSTT